MFTANEDITASSFLNTPANESHAALRVVAYAVTTARTSSTTSFDNGVNVTRKEIANAYEVFYGFSHYYTVHYTDGTWEHVWWARKDIEDFLSNNKEQA